MKRKYIGLIKNNLLRDIIIVETSIIIALIIHGIFTDWVVWKLIFLILWDYIT